MKSKKAMSASFIVGIMITLVAFVVIGGAVTKFLSGFEEKESEVLCRDSLALKAQTKLEVGGAGEISTPILCKTLDKDFSADTKKKAMDNFAANLERCWWMWLEGEKSEMFGPRGVVGSDEKTKCFVCYDLLYQEGPTFTKGELLNYLKESKARKVDATYLDYVQKNGYVDVFESSFSPSEAYAVVFASNIEEDFWQTSHARLLGFAPTYNRNGLWLVKLSTLQKQMPCYLQTDIAGE